MPRVDRDGPGRTIFGACVERFARRAEEITVIRREDGWRTHDLTYSLAADGSFVFQSVQAR